MDELTQITSLLQTCLRIEATMRDVRYEVQMLAESIKKQDEVKENEVGNLQEGTMDKGGINLKPSTSRPPEPPKGQG